MFVSLRSLFCLEDHAALKWSSQFKEPEGQVARWLEQFQEHEFTTEHRPGKSHGNADTLSRRPENSAAPTSSCIETGCTTSPSSGVWILVWSPGELRRKYEADPSIGVILPWKNKCDECSAVTKLAGSSQDIRSLWAQWNRLELFQGVLYRRWEDLYTGVITRQLIIPRALVQEVLQALHNRVGGGHLGQKKTLKKVREQFY